MHVLYTAGAQTCHFDLSTPVDLSLPLSAQSPGVNCFYAPPFQAEPLVAGAFTGSVLAGAPVNFFNVFLNPHGNGTHTECMGHISDRGYTINNCLKKFHFMARLLSITPEPQPGGDMMITADALTSAMQGTEPVEALILRTQPNDDDKRTRQYSGTNPPYLEAAAAAWMAQNGIKHLLIDLPSVDRESDGGALAAHKAFWQYPGEERLDCTITELIFVPNEISDGLYLLNLQIASFELDASPSKPVIYKSLYC